MNLVKRDWSRWLYFWKAMFFTTGGSWWWSPIRITRFSLLYPSSCLYKAHKQHSIILSA